MTDALKRRKNDIVPVKYVLDGSALLCLFNQQAGQGRVRAALTEAVMFAVNYSEVIAELVGRGGMDTVVRRTLDHLHLTVVDFDRKQAIQAGALRKDTRQAGLSFEDHACRAPAISRRLVALTADQAWAHLDDTIAVKVDLVR